MLLEYRVVAVVMVGNGKMPYFPANPEASRSWKYQVPPQIIENLPCTNGGMGDRGGLVAFTWLHASKVDAPGARYFPNLPNRFHPSAKRGFGSQTIPAGMPPRGFAR